MMTLKDYEELVKQAQLKISSKYGIRWTHMTNEVYFATLVKELPDEGLYFILNYKHKESDKGNSWSPTILDKAKQEVDRRVEAVLLGQPQ